MEPFDAREAVARNTLRAGEVRLARNAVAPSSSRTSHAGSPRSTVLSKHPSDSRHSPSASTNTRQSGIPRTGLGPLNALDRHDGRDSALGVPKRPPSGPFRSHRSPLERRMQGSPFLVVELVAGDGLELHLASLGEGSRLIDHRASVLDAGLQRTHLGSMPRLECFRTLRPPRSPGASRYPAAIHSEPRRALGRRTQRGSERWPALRAADVAGPRQDPRLTSSTLDATPPRAARAGAFPDERLRASRATRTPKLHQPTRPSQDLAQQGLTHTRPHSMSSRSWRAGPPSGGTAASGANTAPSDWSPSVRAGVAAVSRFVVSPSRRSVPRAGAVSFRGEEG